MLPPGTAVIPVGVEALRYEATRRAAGYEEAVRKVATDIGNGTLLIPVESYAALKGMYRKPGLLVAAVNAVGALTTWAAAGFPVVDESTLFARSAHCALCPRWDARAGRCLECGCYSLKHWLATEQCPLGHWPAAPLQTP